MDASDQRATLGKGFQIEEPFVFLPWGAPLVQICELLSVHVVSFRDSIVNASGTVLNGLQCSMLLHGTRSYGQSATRERLAMISFWKQGDFRATFDEIQGHLERTFGPPEETLPGGNGGPADCKWVLHGVVIAHYVEDRGGLQGRASIRRMY
jgi:hypothetical protein